MTIDTSRSQLNAGSAAKMFAPETYLRSILETIPDAMIVIDEQGHILSFSVTAERMFGYTENEMLGQNVKILMPSPDRETHDGYIERYIRTGERHIIGTSRISTARHKNGTTFPVNLTVGEANIEGNRIFTGFIQDLTERQETESRVHELQSELAHVSRISAMGTLAASLAHELNQPLAAIANYTEAARDMLQNPDVKTIATIRKALDECAAQSIRAGQIVRRLRDFVTRGETEHRIESLRRLVTEASALALVGVGEHGIDVQIRLDPSVDAVLVDRISIQQVILNLIRNSIEAMEKSQNKQLWISSSKETDGFARISIADSGPGLPQEITEHLFQPFVSTKSHGMGLGLSICHTIITGNGGHIWAEPSELGGTAFHFTVIDASGEGDGTK